MKNHPYTDEIMGHFSQNIQIQGPKIGRPESSAPHCYLVANLGIKNAWQLNINAKITDETGMACRSVHSFYTHPMGAFWAWH